MATRTITPPTEEAGSLLDRRHRVTVEEYHRMAEAGVFGPESRVELLEGVVVDKMTKDPPHVIATDLLDDLLHRLLPPGFFVSMASPVTIVERESEPEPDVAIVRGRPRDYAGRRRTRADAALAIEVADSNYHVDRFHKWITYAGVGVPIYWIVDLNRNRLEIHAGPTGRGDVAHNARTQVLGPDEEATIVLDGREVAQFPVREVLP